MLLREGMRFFHFAARAHWPHRPFVDRGACSEMWTRLRARFERCCACVLMPNHLHLILEAIQGFRIDVTRRTLAVELRAFGRRWFPGKSLWHPVGAPEEIVDPSSLMRHIRYVHLNPCRRGLARDPLNWEWSTHRDALHAASPLWMDVPRIAQLWRKPSFAPTFHAYVSGDPSVNPAGTPLPVPRQRLNASLDAIAHAIIQATHADPGGPRRHGSDARKLIVHLARQLGSARTADLAQLLAVCPRTIQNLSRATLSASDRRALESARFLLSDPRFLP